MASKITVIGAGSVGATIAYTLSQQTFASEIVIIDINKEKVDGEAMDIVQGTAFRDPVDVISGDYEDAKDSDLVIITSGVPRKAGQTRIELAQTNVNIIKDIAPRIAAVAPKALYIIVSNPVDVMTYAFLKASKLPENQIIGSGTLLDTTRLRYGLANHFKIAQKNIHAYVFGEHGDSAFIPWSLTDISGAPMERYAEIMKGTMDFEPLDREAMTEYVHKAGGEGIKRKGATFYAVSASVCQLCSLLLASSDSVATVSTMMHGQYGVDDVCISTLTLVGPEGVKCKLPVALTEEETEKLHQSANTLKNVISQINL